MKDENDAWMMFSAMMLGGLIGAGLVFLFAPQNGEETRARIAEKARQVWDDAAKTAGETTNRTGKVVGELTDRARDTASSIFRRTEKSNVEMEAKSKSTFYR